MSFVVSEQRKCKVMQNSALTGFEHHLPAIPNTRTVLLQWNLSGIITSFFCRESQDDKFINWGINLRRLITHHKL